MNNLMTSFQISDIIYDILPKHFSGLLGHILFIIISLGIVYVTAIVKSSRNSDQLNLLGIYSINIIVSMFLFMTGFIESIPSGIIGLILTLIYIIVASVPAFLLKKTTKNSSFVKGLILIYFIELLFFTQKTLGGIFEAIVNWMKDNLDFIFDKIRDLIEFLVDAIDFILSFDFIFVILEFLGFKIPEDTIYVQFLPGIILLILVTILAYNLSGKTVAKFTFLGLLIINFIGYWDQMVLTLAMVMVSTFIAVLVGIPLGILAARHERFNSLIRPVLDLMQTMPAYVYLIPAVLFFQLGTVPGVFATIIFSMPPAVRLTNLGIRQVPGDVVEAAQSFGTTNKQLLFKVQLPLAKPTIMAGLNQTIMLALSMVVISAMIGAKGLGLEVYNSITQLKIGQGFESGISIVLLAMVLDRITNALGTKEK